MYVCRMYVCAHAYTYILTLTMKINNTNTHSRDVRKTIPKLHCESEFGSEYTYHK